MQAIGRPPTRVGSSEAPNIAIERGRKSASSECLATSAVVIRLSRGSVSSSLRPKMIVAEVTVATLRLVGFQAIDGAVVHLVGPVEDTQEPRAREGAANRCVVGCTHGSEELHGPVRDVLVGAGDADLDQRNLLARALVADAIQEPCGLQYHEA